MIEHINLAIDGMSTLSGDKPFHNYVNDVPCKDYNG